MLVGPVSDRVFVNVCGVVALPQLCEVRVSSSTCSFLMPVIAFLVDEGAIRLASLARRFYAFANAGFGHGGREVFASIITQMSATFSSQFIAFHPFLLIDSFLIALIFSRELSTVEKYASLRTPHAGCLE